MDGDGWTCLHLVGKEILGYFSNVHISRTRCTEYWSQILVYIIFVDDYFPSGMDKLIQQFGGEVHKSEKGDDDQNFSKKDLNVIGKFIVDQKKKTRQIGESRVLELRNQLYTAEQQASRLIAERIAEDPPSVLMAVVAPKAVAACVGGIKRRGPNEEGGGAPCPPEFLLRRETRFQGDADGASSRVHPDDEQEQRSND